jgi:predicted Zn-dependent protease
LEKLFLTHPPTDERIANLNALLASSTWLPGLRLDSDDFQEVRARVRELYPAPKPDEHPKKKGKKNGGGTPP